MPDSSNIDWEFRKTEELYPHEEIIDDRLEEVIRALRRSKVLEYPILVDRTTGVILDGHHRFHALSKLGAVHIPTNLVCYEEDTVTLEPGPNCPVSSLKKADVISRGLQGEIFPPKSTRHVYTTTMPKANILLTDIVEGGL